MAPTFLSSFSLSSSRSNSSSNNNNNNTRQLRSPLSASSTSTSTSGSKSSPNSPSPSPSHSPSSYSYSSASPSTSSPKSSSSPISPPIPSTSNSTYVPSPKSKSSLLLHIPKSKSSSQSKFKSQSYSSKSSSPSKSQKNLPLPKPNFEKFNSPLSNSAELELDLDDLDEELEDEELEEELGREQDDDDDERIEGIDVRIDDDGQYQHSNRRGLRAGSTSTFRSPPDHHHHPDRSHLPSVSISNLTTTTAKGPHAINPNSGSGSGSGSSRSTTPNGSIISSRSRSGDNRSNLSGRGNGSRSGSGSGSGSITTPTSIRGGIGGRAGGGGLSPTPYPYHGAGGSRSTSTNGSVSPSGSGSPSPSPSLNGSSGGGGTGGSVRPISPAGDMVGMGKGSKINQPHPRTSPTILSSTPMIRSRTAPTASTPSRGTNFLSASTSGPSSPSPSVPRSLGSGSRSSPAKHHHHRPHQLSQHSLSVPPPPLKPPPMGELPSLPATPIRNKHLLEMGMMVKNNGDRTDGDDDEGDGDEIQGEEVDRRAEGDLSSSSSKGATTPSTTDLEESVSIIGTSTNTTSSVYSNLDSIISGSREIGMGNSRPGSGSTFGGGGGGSNGGHTHTNTHSHHSQINDGIRISTNTNRDLNPRDSTSSAGTGRVGSVGDSESRERELELEMEMEREMERKIRGGVGSGGRKKVKKKKKKDGGGDGGEIGGMDKTAYYILYGRSPPDDDEGEKSEDSGEEEEECSDEEVDVMEKEGGGGGREDLRRRSLSMGLGIEDEVDVVDDGGQVRGIGGARGGRGGGDNDGGRGPSGEEDDSNKEEKTEVGSRYRRDSAMEKIREMERKYREMAKEREMEKENQKEKDKKGKGKTKDSASPNGGNRTWDDNDDEELEQEDNLDFDPYQGVSRRFADGVGVGLVGINSNSKSRGRAPSLRTVETGMDEDSLVEGPSPALELAHRAMMRKGSGGGGDNVIGSISEQQSISDDLDHFDYYPATNTATTRDHHHQPRFGHYESHRGGRVPSQSQSSSSRQTTPRPSPSHSRKNTNAATGISNSPTMTPRSLSIPESNNSSPTTTLRGGGFPWTSPAIGSSKSSSPTIGPNDSSTATGTVPGRITHHHNNNNPHRNHNHHQSNSSSVSNDINGHQRRRSKSQPPPPRGPPPAGALPPPPEMPLPPVLPPGMSMSSNSNRSRSQSHRKGLSSSVSNKTFGGVGRGKSHGSRPGTGAGHSVSSSRSSRDIYEDANDWTSSSHSDVEEVDEEQEREEEELNIMTLMGLGGTGMGHGFGDGASMMDVGMGLEGWEWARRLAAGPGAEAGVDIASSSSSSPVPPIPELPEDHHHHQDIVNHSGKGKQSNSKTKGPKNSTTEEKRKYHSSRYPTKGRSDDEVVSYGQEEEEQDEESEIGTDTDRGKKAKGKKNKPALDWISEYNPSIEDQFPISPSDSSRWPSPYNSRYLAGSSEKTVSKVVSIPSIIRGDIYHHAAARSSSGSSLKSRAISDGASSPTSGVGPTHPVEEVPPLPALSSYPEGDKDGPRLERRRFSGSISKLHDFPAPPPPPQEGLPALPLSSPDSSNPPTENEENSAPASGSSAPASSRNSIMDPPVCITVNETSPVIAPAPLSSLKLAQDGQSSALTLPDPGDSQFRTSSPTGATLGRSSDFGSGSTLSLNKTPTPSIRSNGTPKVAPIDSKRASRENAAKNSSDDDDHLELTPVANRWQEEGDPRNSGSDKDRRRRTSFIPPSTSPGKPEDHPSTSSTSRSVGAELKPGYRTPPSTTTTPPITRPGSPRRPTIVTASTLKNKPSLAFSSPSSGRGQFSPISNDLEIPHESISRTLSRSQSSSSLGSSASPRMAATALYQAERVGTDPRRIMYATGITRKTSQASSTTRRVKRADALERLEGKGYGYPSISTGRLGLQEDPLEEEVEEEANGDKGKGKKRLEEETPEELWERVKRNSKWYLDFDKEDDEEEPVSSTRRKGKDDATGRAELMRKRSFTNHPFAVPTDGDDVLSDTANSAVPTTFLPWLDPANAPSPSSYTRPSMREKDRVQMLAGGFKENLDHHSLMGDDQEENDYGMKRMLMGAESLDDVVHALAARAASPYYAPSIEDDEMEDDVQAWLYNIHAVKGRQNRNGNKARMERESVERATEMARWGRGRKYNVDSMMSGSVGAYDRLARAQDNSNWSLLSSIAPSDSVSNTKSVRGRSRTNTADFISYSEMSPPRMHFNAADLYEPTPPRSIRRSRSLSSKSSSSFSDPIPRERSPRDIYSVEDDAPPLPDPSTYYRHAPKASTSSYATSLEPDEAVLRRHQEARDFRRRDYTPRQERQNSIISTTSSFSIPNHPFTSGANVYGDPHVEPSNSNIYEEHRVPPQRGHQTEFGVVRENRPNPPENPNTSSRGDHHHLSPERSRQSQFDLVLYRAQSLEQSHGRPPLYINQRLPSKKRHETGPTTDLASMAALGLIQVRGADAKKRSKSMDRSKEKKTPRSKPGARNDDNFFDWSDM